MKPYKRCKIRPIILILSIILSLCPVSCERNKNQGKVTVTEQNFSLRQEKENIFTIDAKGKIKNSGEVDVKNVVVTGYCRDCGEVWAPGLWFASDVEKLPYQKDIISYLKVGEEKPFQFTGVADIILRANQTSPENMPDQFEIVIVSFETATD